MYLNSKTYYSYRYGTYATKELVDAGSLAGATSLAITNINSTADAWDFVKYCQEASIKPIVGVEIRNGDILLYILIAANNEGLLWIHQFMSDHFIASKNFPSGKELDDFTFFKSPADGFVIFPLNEHQPTTEPKDDKVVRGKIKWQKLLNEKKTAEDFPEIKKNSERLLERLSNLKFNERIGIKPSELNKLFGISIEQYAGKMVVRTPVTVQDKRRFNLHRLLRAIDSNCLLSKLPVEAQCEPDEVMISIKEIVTAFSSYPTILTATENLINACNISIDFAADKNKKTFTGAIEDDRVLLEKLALGGLADRYGKKNKIAQARLKKELKIINDLGFNSYFLINWDIIRYAKSRGFYTVGRGSGGNSIVAYCIGITDVDPVELNLFFERFLNPHRSSPPDFDLDFSWTDRDDVMDYIFKRYGTKYVSLLGAITTFKSDSCIRELGKVFGLSDDEIKVLQRSGQPTNSIEGYVIQYARLMRGFPNISSVHACGVLITDAPIHQYTTTFLPPKGLPVSQIDMFIADAISINKFDILSQRGLGHIRTALELIKKNKGQQINIHDFDNFRKDERVKKQIREANTIGCFYIESPAMRGLLMKLKCDEYLTLVAASSIIRPGVAQSGMMRAYIERYHNRDKVQYLHPLFEEHLSETFGVMVFQEDVIKIAHYFAGLDLGEADILRRAMTNAKYRARNEFALVEKKFFSNCKELGYTDELTKEVWRQMESFAGYSFNKAHSASFAIESYMSLYLKTYFPQEFMVAVINNFGGFYSRELYFIELMKCGGKVNEPCINTSDEYTNIKGDEVYIGFIHIKRLENKFMELMLEERQRNGPYLSIQDFIERTKVTKEQVTILVSAGCFRFTGKSKKRLLWEANFLQGKNKNRIPAAISLFEEKPIEFKMPPEIDYDHPIDNIHDQLETFGFSTGNPFALVDDDPGKYVYARMIKDHIGKQITVLIYFIAHKQTTTIKDEAMSFGTFIDPEMNWIDTVHFPDSIKKYPIEKDGFYRARGKVTEDFGVCSLEVSFMEKVGYKVRDYAGL